MNKHLLLSVIVLALVAVCPAQVVPPQDCASRSQQDTGCPTQPPPKPSVTGSGTAGSIPVFTAPSVIGDSVITQSAAGAIAIGGQNLGNAKLSVSGDINSSANIAAAQDVSANNVKAAAHVSASQYDIGAERVLATPGVSNSFAGVGAGRANTGSSNAFFGTNVGTSNGGNANSAFGAAAGFGNTFGSNNSFFGAGAGQFNSQGSGNTFVGAEAGLSNNDSRNSFFGHSAGKNFSVGHNVTLLGAETGASPGIHHATAVGSLALAVQSNSLILGSVDDTPGAVDVGIGTNTPRARLRFAVVIYTWVAVGVELS